MADRLTFLKEYSKKREKVEEEKLKLAREINEEKKGFFNRFFDYMEKKSESPGMVKLRQVLPKHSIDTLIF